MVLPKMDVSVSFGAQTVVVNYQRDYSKYYGFIVNTIAIHALVDDMRHNDLPEMQ